MMADCKFYQGILSEQDYKDIADSHEGFFVKGLSFADQRSIVKSISNQIYRDALQGKTADIPTSKLEFANQVYTRLKEFETTIE